MAWSSQQAPGASCPYANLDAFSFWPGTNVMLTGLGKEGYSRNDDPGSYLHG